MRLKYAKPPLIYVVAIQLKAKTWDQCQEDRVIDALEEFVNELNGCEFEPAFTERTWLADEVLYDYIYSFDTVGERRKFVKALKRSLDKELGVVTCLDLVLG